MGKTTRRVEKMCDGLDQICKSMRTSGPNLVNIMGGDNMGALCRKFMRTTRPTVKEVRFSSPGRRSIYGIWVIKMKN